MKILVVGRDAKYNAEYFYLKAFKSLGHEVAFIDQYKGLRYGTLNRYLQSRIKLFDFLKEHYPVNKQIKTYANAFQPDIILIFKGEFISKKTIKELSENFKTTLFWPDAYKFKPLLSGRLHYFDIIYTAANNLEFYYKLGARRVVTVPWACDPDFHKSLNLPFTYNVSFIGTAYLERRRIIRKLKLSDIHVFGDYWFGFKNRHPAVYGEDYVKTINATKINLNLQAQVSVRADAPTMRTFEVAGCKGFQISDYMPSIMKYFPEMVTFRDLKELKELISYYLENEEERSEIVTKTQDRCYKYFTYNDSAKIILRNL